jgi:hypothetical protein
MSMTVADRGRAIATFRFVEVRLMEIAALWTPTTPEMEAKVMFGRHIWDFAQSADALGKRTFELRLPLQHSRVPVDAYTKLLDDLAATRGTAERLSALYDGLLPGLCDRLRSYVSETDGLLDAPSVVAIERILQTHGRQREDVARLRTELDLQASAGAGEPVRARESSISTMVHAG